MVFSGGLFPISSREDSRNHTTVAAALFIWCVFGVGMSQEKSLAMMPWFPRDFIAATRHLALAERGAYRELLDHQWELGRLPSDETRLARILGVTLDEFRPIWASICDKFAEIDGYMLNKRLEQHRKDALDRRDRKVDGANKTNAKRYADRDAKRLDIASPPSPSPSPSPVKKKIKSKRPIPEDFQLDDELQQYAQEKLPAVDPPELLQSFRNKAQAAGWSYVDWRRAFQEYVRNAAPGSGHWAAGQYPKKTNGFEGQKWT